MPGFAVKKYSFGLCEPEPQSWTESGAFESLAKHVMRWSSEYRSEPEFCPRMVLIKTIVPKKRIFVLDSAYISDFWKANGFHEKQYFLGKYLESFRSAEAYRGGYALPEIVTKEILPPDRLTCIWTGRLDELIAHG